VASAAVVTAVTGCGLTGGTDPAEPGPTVLAASSLTDVFAELVELYEEDHPDEQVTLTFAASSSLREQALSGAPADVVALADEGMGDELYAADVLADPPLPFARNELVIAVPTGNPEGIDELGDLDRDRLLVGVCAAHVPCGALARQVLDTAGLDIRFTSHEPNARSLLTKIEERELDAGLVYFTDTLDRETVESITPPDLPADPDLTATYTLGPTHSGPDDPAADFVDLVLSPAGQEVLAAHGFLPVE
jgi:molybdate transport system substrate-binding protein